MNFFDYFLFFELIVYKYKNKFTIIIIESFIFKFHTKTFFKQIFKRKFSRIRIENKFFFLKKLYYFQCDAKQFVQKFIIILSKIDYFLFCCF